MNRISIMHQSEMDIKLCRFNDAVNKLQGLPKKKKPKQKKESAKYIVIEPFETACEKVLNQMDAVDNSMRHYLKGRVHVEKELWIIASIKNLIDYGYLKIEE